MKSPRNECKWKGEVVPGQSLGVSIDYFCEFCKKVLLYLYTSNFILCKKVTTLSAYFKLYPMYKDKRF